MVRAKRQYGFLVFFAVLMIAAYLIMQAGYVFFFKAAYPLGYSQLVEQYCEEFDMPQDLAYSVIYTESGFDPLAKSKVGARGLMQIMPDTFDWTRYRLGESTEESHIQLHQPEVNIKYGIATLSLLLEEFGDSNAAVAAYHAGRGSVNKWLKDERYSSDGKTLEDIPFKDTKAYVHKIESTRKIYRNLYGLSNTGGNYHV